MSSIASTSKPNCSMVVGRVGAVFTRAARYCRAAGHATSKYKASRFRSRQQAPRFQQRRWQGFDVWARAAFADSPALPGDKVQEEERRGEVHIQRACSLKMSESRESCFRLGNHRTLSRRLLSQAPPTSTARITRQTARVCYLPEAPTLETGCLVTIRQPSPSRLESTRQCRLLQKPCMATLSSLPWICARSSTTRR